MMESLTEKLAEEAMVIIDEVPTAVQYCTVLYCTVLYCTVLYCTVLYCTVLYCTEDWTRFVLS